MPATGHEHVVLADLELGVVVRGTAALAVLAVAEPVATATAAAAAVVALVVAVAGGNLVAAAALVLTVAILAIAVAALVLTVAILAIAVAALVLTVAILAIAVAALVLTVVLLGARGVVGPGGRLARSGCGCLLGRAAGACSDGAAGACSDEAAGACSRRDPRRGRSESEDADEAERWRSPMAATRSPLRMPLAPEMPICWASCLSSGSSMADRPVALAGAVLAWTSVSVTKFPLWSGPRGARDSTRVPRRCEGLVYPRGTDVP